MPTGCRLPGLDLFLVINGLHTVPITTEQHVLENLIQKKLAFVSSTCSLFWKFNLAYSVNFLVVFVPLLLRYRWPRSCQSEGTGVLQQSDR